MAEEQLKIYGNHSNENRRIAKNTIVVYVRLFITTIIGLFTSRFVLQALGISDYGLYNVVGGIIAFFSVIAGSMSGTTLRFLNFEIGKKDGNPNKIFNICQFTHICFAFVVLILVETIGIYYILNYLKVEPGKESDAMFVFQVSTIVSCVGIINVPYQSVLTAKEKFTLIAIIDIVNALIKLGLIISLLYYKGDALRYYALIMSVTTFVSFIVYHYLCFKFWPVLVKWNFYGRIRDYKELLIFNNYNLLASIAMIFRTQGSNMLINFFFGTIVNGAYGITRTVQGFVEIFMVNFDVASAPQITQNVGKGDINRASSIASRVCRMSQLLCLLAIFPLYAEIELLLRLWLGNVPEYTISFCRIMLIAVYVSSTGGGILRLKDALGKVKWFYLTFSFLFFLTIPVGYILFKIGFPPSTILVLIIIIDAMCRMCQFILMKIIYNYDIISFIKEGFTKPIIILTLIVPYLMVYNLIDLQGNIEHILGFIVTFIIGVLLIFTIGLKNGEREKCYRYLKNKLFKS